MADYTPEVLDNDSQWIKTEFEDGSVKWELKDPPPPYIPESTDPVPADLIGLSQEELYQLSVKAQVDVLRTHREKKLLDSDWTQQPDAPISPEKKEEWRIYRQKLRDLTENIKTVKEAINFIWPTPPQ
jgi:hypothetical protein